MGKSRRIQNLNGAAHSYLKVASKKDGAASQFGTAVKSAPKAQQQLVQNVLSAVRAAITDSDVYQLDLDSRTSDVILGRIASLLDEVKDSFAENELAEAKEEILEEIRGLSLESILKNFLLSQIAELFDRDAKKEDIEELKAFIESKLSSSNAPSPADNGNGGEGGASGQEASGQTFRDKEVNSLKDETDGDYQDSTIAANFVTMQNFVQQQVDQLNDHIAAIPGGLGLGKLVKFVGTSIGRCVVAVGKLGSKVGSFAKKSLAGIVNVSKFLAGGAFKGITKTLGFLKSGIGKLFKGIGSLSKNVFGKIKSLGSKIGSLGKNIFGKFKGLGGKLAGLGKGLIGKIANPFKKIGNIFKSKEKKFDDKYKNEGFSWKTLKNWLLDFFKVLFSPRKIMKTLKNLIKSGKAIVDKILIKPLSKLIDKLGWVLLKAITYLGLWLFTILLPINIALLAIEAAVFGIVFAGYILYTWIKSGKLWAKLKSLGKILLDGAIKFIKALPKIILGAIKLLFWDIPKMLFDFGYWIGENLPDWLMKAWEWLKDIGAWIWDKLKIFGNWLWNESALGIWIHDKIITPWQQTMQEIDSAGGLWPWFKEKLSQWWDQVCQIAKAIGNAVADWWKKTDVYQAYQEIKQKGFGQWFKDKIQQFVDNMLAIGKKVKEWWDSTTVGKWLAGLSVKIENLKKKLSTVFVHIPGWSGGKNIYPFAPAVGKPFIVDAKDDQDAMNKKEDDRILEIQQKLKNDDIGWFESKKGLEKELQQLQSRQKARNQASLAQQQVQNALAPVNSLNNMNADNNMELQKTGEEMSNKAAAAEQATEDYRQQQSALGSQYLAEMQDMRKEMREGFKDPAVVPMPIPYGPQRNAAMMENY